MKYFIIVCLSLIFSCNSKENNEFIDVNHDNVSALKFKDKDFQNFIETFEEIKKLDTISIIQSLNENRYSYPEQYRIKDSLAVKFICVNKNLCLNENSIIKNRYFKLFRYEMNNNLLLLFYRKTEFPHSNKTFVSVIDRTNGFILNTLLLSGRVLSAYESDVRIDSNLVFHLKRVYEEKRNIETNIPLRPNDTISEKYFLNSSGKFEMLD